MPSLYSELEGDALKGIVRELKEVKYVKEIVVTLGPASEGIVFSDGLFKTLFATYVRTSQDMLKRYEDDAAINGLVFDRHEESLAVETFTRGIMTAAETIIENPLGPPLIPSWDRVTSAIPDILNRIRETVEEDNK